MKTLSALWFSLRTFLLRSRADAELDEELSYHLEREAALYRQQGMSPAEARREAIRQFGGLQRYREECRDVRRTSLIDDLVADVTFALRLIKLHPAFSANVILVAALGITVCTSAFSVVSGVLLSPLPFPDADRVAALHLRTADGTLSAAVPVAVYRRIAAESTIVEAVGAFRPGGATIEWNGEPERAKTELVTSAFFKAFGVAPAIGRTFTDIEADQRAPVALLGYELWQTRFNADPDVVGRRVTLDSVAYTIIGVIPRQFRAHFTLPPDLWLPMSLTYAAAEDATVNAVLRLRDDVPREKAHAWISAVADTKVASTTAADSVAATPTLTPITELIYGYLERPLLVFFGAVLLVLALVAANVTTMLLARSAARQRELGVRRALGASEGRQLRQLVTESATLTAIGGAIGVIASYWIVGAIRGMGIRILPRMDSVALDWRVLFFAVAGTVFTGIIGGLVPAFTSRGRDGLRDTAGGRVTGRGTSSALVVAQITLSVVLLVGAGLLMKSFLRILPTDPGFAIDNRAILSLSLRGQSTFPDSDRSAPDRFIRLTEQRLRSVRGVRDVAVMSFVPFTGLFSTTQIEVPGQPAPPKPYSAFQNVVTANFFEVMHVDVRRGRAFSAGDDAASGRVAIVNETAAARWWPGEDPIGKQLLITGRDRRAVTVVGVMRDSRLNGNDTRIRPEIYFPVAQSNPRTLSFIVRTNVDPRSIVTELRRAVWSVVPRVPLTRTTDLATIAAESVSRTRFFSWMMTAFAVAAVGLSALAVYGLLAFTVTQRRREIGIRLALGATPRAVGVMILRGGLVLGIAGVVIGVVLARALSRFMASILLEVSATDATVYLATGVGALVVAIVAAGGPAYQAVRVDPVGSLRES